MIVQRWIGPRSVWALLAAASFSIAGLAGAGAILSSDAAGRAIFAAAWVAIGVAWTGRWFIERRRRQENETEADDTSDASP